ncbi:ATP-binding protein [Streptomyces broussonetiae]|uniref:ATP-binding protein n=1 Tax=Streptomyces broussonetiae TaxID=2686304 RepID=A0ABV5EMB3_9ACTN
MHNWSMGYPMTPRSIRLARLHTRRRLTLWQWPGDIDDAVLVTSELVANAVRHGRLPGHELELALRTGAGTGDLTVDVSDPLRVFPTLDKDPDDEAEGGRGLLVVSLIAAELDWFPRRDEGKTVRALLRVARKASEV